eukprot:12890881-Prorocentrum_lima.AAC.1
MPSPIQEVSSEVTHQGTSSGAVRRPQSMTLAQESALGITLTNPSRLTLKELMHESAQRTLRSSSTQRSASS